MPVSEPTGPPDDEVPDGVVGVPEPGTRADAVRAVWRRSRGPVAPAAAPTTFGDLAGRVLDSQGAAVPGATVTATNAANGLVRSTVSGSIGDYLLVQLPPGRYSVAAELSGFRRAVFSDLEVDVGTRQTPNIELAIGNLTEVVEVTGVVPLIETTRSEIAGVVTPREIQNLPLLNRTFAGLSVVMPEARPVGNFDPTKTRLGSIAMSGGDGRQLDVNVDGGDNKDNVVGSLLQNFAYESIQECQVGQHRWSAESGRAVGGVVNVVTKSGTNDLRGSLFSNFRSNDTRAKDFFEGRANRDKSDYERQEFGGSLGGPIRREQLFFFGAMERFRERQKTPVLSTACRSWRRFQAPTRCAPGARRLRPDQRPRHGRPACPQVLDRCRARHRQALQPVERLRPHARLRRAARAGDQPAHPVGVRPDVPRFDAGRRAVRPRGRRAEQSGSGAATCRDSGPPGSGPAG